MIPSPPHGCGRFSPTSLPQVRRPTRIFSRVSGSDGQMQAPAEKETPLPSLPPDEHRPALQDRRHVPTRVPGENNSMIPASPATYQDAPAAERHFGG